MEYYLLNSLNQIITNSNHLDPKKSVVIYDGSNEKPSFNISKNPVRVSKFWQTIDAIIYKVCPVKTAIFLTNKLLKLNDLHNAYFATNKIQQLLNTKLECRIITLAKLQDLKEYFTTKKVDSGDPITRCKQEAFLKGLETAVASDTVTEAIPTLKEAIIEKTPHVAVDISEEIEQKKENIPENHRLETSQEPIKYSKKLVTKTASYPETEIQLAETFIYQLLNAETVKPKKTENSEASTLEKSKIDILQGIAKDTEDPATVILSDAKTKPVTTLAEETIIEARPDVSFDKVAEQTSANNNINILQEPKKNPIVIEYSTKDNYFVETINISKPATIIFNATTQDPEINRLADQEAALRESQYIKCQQKKILEARKLKLLNSIKKQQNDLSQLESKVVSEAKLTETQNRLAMLKKEKMELNNNVVKLSKSYRKADIQEDINKLDRKNIEYKKQQDHYNGLIQKYNKDKTELTALKNKEKELLAQLEKVNKELYAL